jgi:uncharacterized protein
MRCPTCRKNVDPATKFRPFCSERCKLIDLGRWLSGSYVVPGEPATEDDLAGLDEDDEAGDGEIPRRH